MLLSLQRREWLEYFVISVRRRRSIFVTGDVIWDYCCLLSRARPPPPLLFIVMRKTLITIYNPSHAKVAPIFTPRFLPKQFIAASLTHSQLHAALCLRTARTCIAKQQPDRTTCRLSYASLLPQSWAQVFSNLRHANSAGDMLDANLTTRFFCALCFVILQLV